LHTFLETKRCVEHRTKLREDKEKMKGLWAENLGKHWVGSWVFAGENIWVRQGADRWICRWRTCPLMQKVEETTLMEKSSTE